jgi:hypothetical protein
MCDLTARVNPGIGAACARETHGFGGHAPEGSLGHLLQRRHARLRLPAGIGAAIVLDADSNPQQRIPSDAANGADVRQNRCGQSAGRSRQKPRLLPAATKPMSAKIAAGDFGQFD